MRRYEAMFIVDVDLDEDQIQRIVDRYSKIITDGGGTISYAGKWEQGRRKLAYDIARRREGMYLIIQFESNADVPKELDRIYRISDEVFRHIIVLQNELVPLLTQQVVEPAPEPAAQAAPAEEAPEEEPTAEAEAEPDLAAESEEVVEAEAAEEPVTEEEATEEPAPEPVAV